MTPQLIHETEDELFSISWHHLSAEQALDKLATQPQNGISSEEASRRLEKYGPNQLVEKPRPTFLQMLFRQLKSFIIILLIVAAVISAFLGDEVEAIAILAIVVLNAVLGVIQENRAEQALAALKKLAAPEAAVIRDGRRVSVPAGALVPGDLVLLEAGNYIPADIRLLETVNLRIEEAALTGESVPVQKNAALQFDADASLGDRKNTAFMGTLVNYGRGRGVVTSTGMHTQLGLIANMLQAVEEEETPLQKRLDNLGKLLGYAALVVCLIVFISGMLRSDYSFAQISAIFMIAVSLAIAAVPEGLPAIVTISLALGMREMVQRHALIRRLASVETLGSATTICSDKTGTLTQNEMTVTRVWTSHNLYEISGQGYGIEGDFSLAGKRIELNDHPALLNTLWVGVLNNDAELDRISVEGEAPAYRMIGDPTEGSILVAAAKAGVYLPDITKAYPRASEIPFDSGRKRMVTMHLVDNLNVQDISPIYEDSKKNWHAIAVKGAPDVVLGLCDYYLVNSGKGDTTSAPLDEKTRAAILAANDGMTKDALRVLGLAYRLVPDLPAEDSAAEVEKELIFVGMVGMIDPPRAEVSPALNKARQAGIRTIMITGDYPNTARAIGEAIGLLRPGASSLTGAQLNEIDDDQLREAVKETDIFARVSPEHKMRIVDALRANGEVVAMTGDGVNDAPAIKRADIGVAMGITGTDVAKETADMVLTDDNYASIVAAVEQGRIIYSNIRKFVYFLISCNLAEIMIIFIPTLIGLGSPLTAIQLLWLNLVTDGAPALALGTEKGDPDIMQQPPRPPKESIINRAMLIGVIVQTIAISAVTLLAYFVGMDKAHPEHAETMAFLTLSLSELFRAFTARSERYPLVKLGIFSNRWMNIAVLVSLAMVLGVVYIPALNGVFNTMPLGWAEWQWVAPLLLVPSIAAELTKVVVTKLKIQG